MRLLEGKVTQIVYMEQRRKGKKLVRNKKRRFYKNLIVEVEDHYKNRHIGKKSV